MSEIELLKKRIEKANYNGLETSIIRDDYEPAGQMMINDLVNSGEYISRRDYFDVNQPWKVWKSGFEPKA